MGDSVPIVDVFTCVFSRNEGSDKIAVENARTQAEAAGYTKDEMCLAMMYHKDVDLYVCVVTAFRKLTTKPSLATASRRI